MPSDSYRTLDPTFNVRVVNLSTLLNDRRLDGIAALALYGLSFLVDWETHDQAKIFSQLSHDAITRLTIGQRRIAAKSSNHLQLLLGHSCVITCVIGRARSTPPKPCKDLVADRVR